MAESYPIAEVGARIGLTAHTLRYYERAGLINPGALAPTPTHSAPCVTTAPAGISIGIRTTSSPRTWPPERNRHPRPCGVECGPTPSDSDAVRLWDANRCLA